MSAQKNGTLRLIGIFKLFKGLLLILVAFGAFHLLHKDLATEIEHWIREFRIDPDNRHLARLLAKANLVDARKLKELGGLTLVYAALFLTEGTGLLLGQRWAEYLTVIATGSFIPLEIYEMCRHFGPIKLAAFVINVAIVLYLLFELRRERR